MVNTAVFAVFLTLEATEIVLFIGNFAANTNIVKIGGYVGILTALCAWYASAAGVGNGMAGRVHPPGGPAVHQAVFLTKDPPLIPGACPPRGGAFFLSSAPARWAA